MPGICAIFGRISSITLSTCGRLLGSIRRANTLPVFRLAFTPPPPTVEVYDATFGFSAIALAMICWCLTMSSNEMPCLPSVKAKIWPWSSLGTIPTGFLPSEDQGQIFAFTEGKQGISFDDMVKHQQIIAKAIAENPNVASYTSTVGGGGVNASLNTGRVFARLIDPSKRPHVDKVIDEIRPKIAQIPGIRAYLQVPPPIRIGGQLTKSQYQFTLQSSDTTELYHLAPILEQKFRELKGFIDVNSDLQSANPQVTVQIDRDKAAALNVDPRLVEDALYSAYGSRQISTIYAPNNQYKVVMELQPEFQRDPAAIGLLYIHSKTGQLVPLSSMAVFQRNLVPLTVNHLCQTPSATISFNLPPNYPLTHPL